MLWTADITVVNPNPDQAGSFVPAHPPHPDRPLTRADVMAVAIAPN